MVLIIHVCSAIYYISRFSVELKKRLTDHFINETISFLKNHLNVCEQV